MKSTLLRRGLATTLLLCLLSSASFAQFSNCPYVASYVDAFTGSNCLLPGAVTSGVWWKTSFIINNKQTSFTFFNSNQKTKHQLTVSYEVGCDSGVGPTKVVSQLTLLPNTITPYTVQTTCNKTYVDKYFPSMMTNETLINFELNRQDWEHAEPMTRVEISR